MAKHIQVRSTVPTRPDGGNAVVLYETHPDHPDGEAFVAGPNPVSVARTPAVHKLISDGALEVVEEKAAEAPARPAAARTAAAPTNLGGITDRQRDALAAAGYVTADDIRKASDDDLKGVEGIADATVVRLREATKE